VRARTEVHVVAAPPAGPGHFCVARLHCEPPLTVRQTLDGLTMMASAGGPLGGDDLALTLRVGPGAAVTVGSAAGSLVLPAPAGAPVGGDPRAPAAPRRPACVDWRARVDDVALLDWRPEPTVVAGGASLRTRTTLDVAASARVRWREILASGRTGEAGGDLVSSWSVTVGGRPLLRQDVVTGPHAPDGWSGLAGTAGMRVLGTLLVVDPGLDAVPAGRLAAGAPAGPGPDGWVAALPLDGPGVLVTALGMTTLAVTRLLDGAAAGLCAGSGPTETVGPAPEDGYRHTGASGR
jgi:urease accessory protein